MGATSLDVDDLEVTAIVTDRVFPLLLETFLYALYTVLTAYFVHRQWFDRDKSTLPTFMFLVTLSMFALFSAYWIIDVYLLWVAVYRYLPQQSIQSESVMFPDGLWMSAAYYVQTAFQFTMIVLGDTVSLWRAYVIWDRPRWLFRLFICITILESGAYILVLVILCVQGVPQSSHGFAHRFYTKLYTATFIVANVLTATAQLFATLLIAYKAWIHWRAIREFSNQHQVRHGIAMLAVVVESGVVYFALLTWYGLIDILGKPDSIVYASAFYYMTPLIAMYPTLVIVLVATRRSVLERSLMTESPLSFASIRFAANPGMRGDCEDTSSICPTCHRTGNDHDKTFSLDDTTRLRNCDRNVGGAYDQGESLEKYES